MKIPVSRVKGRYLENKTNLVVKWYLIPGDFFCFSLSSAVSFFIRFFTREMRCAWLWNAFGLDTRFSDKMPSRVCKFRKFGGWNNGREPRNAHVTKTNGGWCTARKIVDGTTRLVKVSVKVVKAIYSAGAEVVTRVVAIKSTSKRLRRSVWSLPLLASVLQWKRKEPMKLRLIAECIQLWLISKLN